MAATCATSAFNVSDVWNQTGTCTAVPLPAAAAVTLLGSNVGLFAESHSLLAQATLHTCVCAACCLILQHLVGLITGYLVSVGIWRRTHRPPSAPWLRILAINVLGAASVMAPQAFLQAYLGYKWSCAAPNFFLVGLWALVVSFSHDSMYFLIHRWFHMNKTAFKLFHATHHSHEGNLDVRSHYYVDAPGAMLETGLPIAVNCALTYLVTGNFWYHAVSLLQVQLISITGHCATDASFKHHREALLLLLNPANLWYMLMANRQSPQDHEGHHNNPRANYAPFFTHWDCFNGSGQSAAVNTRPASALLSAAHLCYAAALHGTLQLVWMWPMQSIAAYIIAYLVISPQLAAAAFSALRVPEAVEAVFGGLLDTFRRDSNISFAAPGEPGHFDGTSAEKGAADGAPAGPYIFACHPTGVLSRGALLTFAARGWCSPVSALKRVRFAVGSALLRLPLPFSRELLLAIGCVPADAATLQQLLLSGSSVAITPGGWSEPTHTGSYDLKLKERRGFLNLALETGAALVPVLGLGEHMLAAAPHLYHLPFFCPKLDNWLIRLIISDGACRGVKVVFGQPVVPREGEELQQLRQRYTAALLALGKEHGVALNIK